MGIKTNCITFCTRIHNLGNSSCILQTTVLHATTFKYQTCSLYLPPCRQSFYCSEPFWSKRYVVLCAYFMFTTFLFLIWQKSILSITLKGNVFFSPSLKILALRCIGWLVYKPGASFQAWWGARLRMLQWEDFLPFLWVCKTGCLRVLLTSWLKWAQNFFLLAFTQHLQKLKFALKM